MIYTYYCVNKKCLHSQDENHSVNGFKEFTPPCEKCGRKCEYRFTPSVVHFSLLDGPTGSWPSKGNSFKNYRAKQSEKMEKKQRDRYGEPKQLIPNHKGVQHENWAHARETALKESGPSSAATYNKRVSKEKLT